MAEEAFCRSSSISVGFWITSSNSFGSVVACRVMLAKLLGQLVHNCVDRGLVVQHRDIDPCVHNSGRQRQRCFGGVTILDMVELEA